MSAPDLLPAFPELDDAACQRALAILVDVGTALVLECKTPTPDVPLAARSIAYDRAALAVRRAILLSQHIAQAAPIRAAQAAERAEQAAARDAKRASLRRKVIRAVEDTLDPDADPAEAAALRRELLERIDSAEFDHDLANCQPRQIILELCRDMALAGFPGAHPERRRTPADIAVLCAQAAAPPGSGLPNLFAPNLSPIAHPEPAANDALQPEPSAATRQ